MSEQQFYKEINKVIQTYQPHEMFFPLKAYGVRHIRPSTIKIILVCVVIDYMGMPLTTNLISSITDTSVASVGQIMARLGDKNVLRLRGYQKARLLYEVHSDFKTQLKLDYTAIDEFVTKWNETYG